MDRPQRTTYSCEWVYKQTDKKGQICGANCRTRIQGKPVCHKHKKSAEREFFSVTDKNEKIKEIVSSDEEPSGDSLGEEDSFSSDEEEIRYERRIVDSSSSDSESSDTSDDGAPGVIEALIQQQTKNVLGKRNHDESLKRTDGCVIDFSECFPNDDDTATKPPPEKQQQPVKEKTSEKRKTKKKKKKKKRTTRISSVYSREESDAEGDSTKTINNATKDPESEDSLMTLAVDGYEAVAGMILQVLGKDVSYASEIAKDKMVQFSIKKIMMKHGSSLPSVEQSPELYLAFATVACILKIPDDPNAKTTQTQVKTAVNVEKPHDDDGVI